ncbi:hypothetical protein CCZ01_05395 [Helicobacter monodelphidis]|uniref:DMT family transporter n=1 Tax=Helicobacter sp. 15-1451 TaxID=2004995 RepID=UPI000DCD3B4D|nr:DMT family transporter [Helicobacter sp. 15-1451]RAX57579.1 hypothetical protein CCZ01_05395 [Helicobacter sp. 15-1451]
MRKITKQEALLVALFVAMLFWGGSWATSKMIVHYANIEIIAFWRFLLAAITFTPIIFFFRPSLLISIKSLSFLILVSIFNCLYAFLFFQGITLGMAGAGGVLVTTLIPIFTYILTFFIYHNRIAPYEFFGLVLGICSGFLLLNLDFSSELFVGGNLYFLISALIWALLTLTMQKIRTEVHPITANLYINIFSSLMCCVFIMLFDKGNIMQVFAFDHIFWLGLIFISCLSIAFGNTLYYQAIAILGSNKASAFNLLVPINAMLISWWLLNEVPTINTIVGGSLAIIGIYFINIYKPKKGKNVT